MLQDFKEIQLQADVLAFAVGIGSLLVSTYIALLLHGLSKKFSQNEATRSINERWDNFHTAMLNEEVHDLFWKFIRTTNPNFQHDDRSHHIVLIYLNNVHTEYHTFTNGIFPDYQVGYIDNLLGVFVPAKSRILNLARSAGYDEKFMLFLAHRLDHLTPQP